MTRRSSAVGGPSFPMAELPNVPDRVAVFVMAIVLEMWRAHASATR